MPPLLLKTERHKYHLSQSKIARLVHVHPATVSQWEAGKVKMPGDIAARLNDIFSKMNDTTAEQVLIDSGLRVYRQKRHDIPGTAAPGPRRQKAAAERIDSVNNLKKITLDPAKPKAIALFAGCGGMSAGLKASGFQVVGYAEIEPAFRDVYAANFTNTALLGSDVCDITNDELAAWKQVAGDIDLLAGGPPCQGFSLAGKRDVMDPRNRLYVDYIRIAEHLKPKVVLMENVRLLLTMRTPDGTPVHEDIQKRFTAIGYTVQLKTINAKQYGVPQSRERVVFMAVRNDIGKQPHIPEPTHAAAGNAQNLPAYRTFKDATHDLEPLESGQKSASDPLHFAIVHPDKVIDMLRSIPEGDSAHNHPDPHKRPTSGFNTTYKRIAWDEPSSTITTNFSMISGSRNVHPTNTRSLTIREAARCQTFPDDFIFVGKLSAIRAAIGNAVPPLLAQKLGEAVKQIIG